MLPDKLENGRQSFIRVYLMRILGDSKVDGNSEALTMTLSIQEHGNLFLLKESDYQFIIQNYLNNLRDIL